MLIDKGQYCHGDNVVLAVEKSLVNHPCRLHRVAAARAIGNTVGQGDDNGGRVVHQARRLAGIDQVGQVKGRFIHDRAGGRYREVGRIVGHRETEVVNRQAGHAGLPVVVQVAVTDGGIGHAAQRVGSQHGRAGVVGGIEYLVECCLGGQRGCRDQGQGRHQPC